MSALTGTAELFSACLAMHKHMYISTQVVSGMPLFESHYFDNF